MPDVLVQPPNATIPQPISVAIRSFLKDFKPYELLPGSRLPVYLDKKSGAFYVCCHLQGAILAAKCDPDASLDGDEDDEGYKLNRDITEDESAFVAMGLDAKDGRSFEDLVLEFDSSTRANKPLKVYGGQHRLRAIAQAGDENASVLHGVRVYFELTRDQRVEIATVNNTAIAVPNDLLDRMREQLLGGQLRDWCQVVGLLKPGKDFADRRSPDVPTVRIARTLIVDFYLGKDVRTDEFHQPVICKSGGIDEAYLEVRDRIQWGDPALMAMGKAFAHLHDSQRRIVTERDNDNNAEFARKALSLTVVASWAYAAGLFQSQPEKLAILYSLPDNVASPNDPLNAKALSVARHRGIDPDTYRGLGTRSGPKELGRMLELFLVLADKDKKRITKDIANAAIQAYEAKRAVHEAQKVLGRI